MQKNIFLVFCLSLMLLLTLSVSADDFYFQEGKAIDIKIPCFKYGALCSAATACNITILYPNGSTFVKDGLMTNSGSYQNYSVNDTTTYGMFTVIENCVDGDDYGTITLYYKINFNGENNDGIYVLFGILFVIFVACIIMTMNYMQRESFLTEIFLLLSSIMLTVITYFGWQISKEWGYIVARVVYTTYFTSIILMLILILFILVTYTFMLYDFIVSRKNKLKGTDNLVR